MINPRFVYCTPAHMEIIDKWMSEAFANDQLTLYNNINLLRRDMDSVEVLMLGRKILGFHLGNDLMEVRPCERGKGYGRLIAEKMINDAKIRGDRVLEFEVVWNVADFWEKMGFTTYERNWTVYARMVLQGDEE